MKAILIDPFLRTVTDVEVPEKNESMEYKAMKALIQCDLIDIVRYDKFEVIIDDEGLFSKGDEQAYFNLRNHMGSFDFFAGRALVTSSDIHGNTISPSFDADFIRFLVKWGDKDIGDTTAEKIMSSSPTVIGFETFDDLLKMLGQKI